MSDIGIDGGRLTSFPDGLKRLLWAIALFLILPNVIFWGMRFWFDLGRPVFNLDYLLVGFLFALGWRVPGAVLLVLLFTVDVLVLIGQIYPFLRLHDLVYLAGLLPQASGVFQGLAVLTLLSLVGLVSFLVSAGQRSNLLSVLILLNIGLVFYGAHVYGNPKETTKVWKQQRGTIVDSQSINFIEGRMDGFTGTFSMEGEPFVETGYRGRTAGWAKMSVSELGPKLLLVVAESWGSFQDEDVQRAIVAPVLARKAHMEWLERGDMNFQGATVAAEFRELCGSRPNHFNLKVVEEGFDTCLPRKLSANGYATAAVHGAAGLMYDRVYWYPRAGFDELHFRETDAWKSRCYSFPGVCDREIGKRYIRTAFAGPEKRFIYWLTLNSHAIYDRRDLHGSFFDCAKHDVPIDSDVCRMAELHAQFFHDLADILADESMQGVEVLVVGDHAPPLMEVRDFERYVKPGTVSWLHFKVGAPAVGRGESMKPSPAGGNILSEVDL